MGLTLELVKLVCERPQIKGNARTVLMQLCYHAGDVPVAHPTPETLRDETGLGLNTVRNCLRLLAEAGVIRADGRVGHATLWVIDPTWDGPEVDPAGGLRQRQQCHKPTHSREVAEPTHSGESANILPTTGRLQPTHSGEVAPDRAPQTYPQWATRADKDEPDHLEQENNDSARDSATPVATRDRAPVQPTPNGTAGHGRKQTEAEKQRHAFARELQAQLVADLHARNLPATWPAHYHGKLYATIEAAERSGLTHEAIGEVYARVRGAPLNRWPLKAAAPLALLVETSGFDALRRLSGVNGKQTGERRDAWDHMTDLADLAAKD